MSVTFWIPDAPRTRELVPCDYGRGEPWACAPGRRCGYCEDGFDLVAVSPAPDLNVANETARVLLATLGLPCDDLWGCLTPGRIPAVRREIVRALSSDRPELRAVAGAVYGGLGTGRPLVIDAGVSSDRIRDRLARLDAVLAWAQTHGMTIAWG